MKNKYAVLIVALLVFMAADSLQPAIAQDNSSTNPAAIGSPVRSMVELGSVYTNIYDTTITVLEAVRGKEAMDRLKAADPANRMPAEGFDYVLARVKFEFKGRAVSDKIPFDLGQSAVIFPQDGHFPGLDLELRHFNRGVDQLVEFYFGKPLFAFSGVFQ